jgi:hypothetical protein
MPQIVTPIAPYFPAETWYYNGTALSSPYWNISTFGGSRSGVPTLAGQDVAVAYRAGQSWRPKYPDERTISLTMWTDGSGDATGGWPSADAHLSFNRNWQQLRQLFYTRNAGGSTQGQLQRNWWLTQGGTNKLITSTAMAEIAGSMDLTMNGRTGAAFTVDLLLADPHFYGAVQSVSCGASTVVTALGEGVIGEGWPSAVASFTVVCSAACTVTNATAGVSFTIGTGPAFPVTVDVLNGTITDNSGASQAGVFSHSGSRLWMALLPGSNTIQVSAGTAVFRFSDVYI